MGKIKKTENNKNDELLTDIDQEFNKSLPDSGFSLTKAFNRDGLTYKVVNLLLLAACTVGAFNGYSKIEELVNSRSDNLIIHTEMMKIKYEDTTVISADNLEEISNNKATGVYKIKGTDRLTVLSYDDDDKEVHSDETKNLMNLYEIPKNYSYAVYNPDNMDINYVNIDTNNKNFLYLMDKNALVYQHEDLLTLAHELAHVNLSQLEYEQQANSEGVSDFEKMLVKESSSDLFSVMAVSKIKNLNIEETTKMLIEKSQERNLAMHLNSDYDHSTMVALKGLSNAFRSDSKTFEDLKSLSFDEMDKVLVEFAISSVDKIDIDFKTNPQNLNKNTKELDDVKIALMSPSEDSMQSQELISSLTMDIQHSKFEMEIQEKVSSMKQESSDLLDKEPKKGVSLKTNIKY